jgi:hypothetical protein
VVAVLHRRRQVSLRCRRAQSNDAVALPHIRACKCISEAHRWITGWFQDSRASPSESHTINNAQVKRRYLLTETSALTKRSDLTVVSLTKIVLKSNNNNFKFVFFRIFDGHVFFCYQFCFFIKSSFASTPDLNADSINFSSFSLFTKSLTLNIQAKHCKVNF